MVKPTPRVITAPAPRPITIQDMVDRRVRASAAALRAAKAVDPTIGRVVLLAR